MNVSGTFGGHGMGGRDTTASRTHLVQEKNPAQPVCKVEFVLDSGISWCTLKVQSDLCSNEVT